jgi:hypothetical protein
MYREEDTYEYKRDIMETKKIAPTAKRDDSKGANRLDRLAKEIADLRDEEKEEVIDRAKKLDLSASTMNFFSRLLRLGHTDREKINLLSNKRDDSWETLDSLEYHILKEFVREGRIYYTNKDMESDETKRLRQDTGAGDAKIEITLAPDLGALILRYGDYLDAYGDEIPGRAYVLDLRKMQKLRVE